MRNAMSRILLVAFLGTVVATAGQARAASVAFTSLASWQAAAGTTQVETFSTSTVGDFALPTATSYGPINFLGFSISGNPNGDHIGVHTGVVSNAGSDTPIPASFLGQNFVSEGNVDGGLGPITTLTFTTPVTAFGFDWFNTDVSDRDQVTINPGGTVFTNPPFNLATTTASTGFFGVVSDTPITSITITTSSVFGGYVSDRGFDNFRTSATNNNAVPEPSSIVSAAASVLMGLGYAWRRRRRVAA